MINMDNEEEGITIKQRLVLLWYLRDRFNSGECEVSTINVEKPLGDGTILETKISVVGSSGKFCIYVYFGGEGLEGKRTIVMKFEEMLLTFKTLGDFLVYSEECRYDHEFERKLSGWF